ncbi:MAG: hypothetical protein ACI9MC_001105 [Kiritimatiellia bacterium]|jgi:hypothetical protein
MRNLLIPAMAVALFACSAPEDVVQQVGFQDGRTTSGQNGERGSVKISEILWSGSILVDDSGNHIYDPTDIFIELRNESARPINLSNWIIRVRGVDPYALRLPKTDRLMDVGEHMFIAAKDTGCFPEPDWVIEDLRLPRNDPFSLTLQDIDERLIEGAGSRYAPPFAGGYDLVHSRSMEMAQLMFGARGNQPHVWHHYTKTEVDIPNNLKVAEACREFTGASPGAANSPDYAGSFAAGAFD